MERFADLTPKEVSVLRWEMYILMDDYETGTWNNKSEYEIASKIYNELGEKYETKEQV